MPVVCGPGNKEAGHAGRNHHQQKHRVDAGKNRQVHQQTAHILEKHRQCFPNVLCGLIVSAAGGVCFFTELYKVLLQCVGIRGADGLIRNLPDNRGADIYTWGQRILLDILLKALNQEQCGSEYSDGHQQLPYRHPLLHLGKNLRRNVQLHQVQKNLQRSGQKAEQERSFSVLPRDIYHPPDILKGVIFGLFFGLHFASPHVHSIAEKIVPG